ncbi:NOL1/NOP2/sun family putative RNA met [Melanomma pulvis-pyrius CBS 109.77]|uniref:Nucleolar protein 2 n=1 Tax=Melanomma pulvis-pyrius CBS 109.77 TaxID=1314802 RepID=A0A6A6XPS4_9PLEO|nr:NOL1/NOP2/sun family putative RNA met [Melanomma pulvis-pyrius CBS 109.77]
MGVGNRFKKQGPPGPLDESLVTRKRKDAPPAAAEPRGKKRSRTEVRAFKKEAKVTAKANNPNKIAMSDHRAKAKPVKKLVPAPVSDEEMSDADDLETAMEGVNVTGLDALGSASESEDLVDDEFPDSDSDIVDSDDDVRKVGMWSDDEDEEEVKEKLTAANIVGLSRKLDMQKAIEDAEAQAELEEAALTTNIAGDRPKILEDEEDDEGQPISKLATQDLQLLRTRLNDTIRVLDDFKNLAEEGRSRVEYRAQLLKDICAYYGYSEFLADKLLNLFPAREAFAFFEANETPRPMVIRTNTLRTHRRELAQTLINRGVQLEPVGKWSKVGLQIFESQVPLGATPEYLAGHYILQAASSFLPVMALAPQENERVLDMAAAPGGKTTHIAALMKNTGCVFANDSNKSRAKGLIGNIHRLGVKNTIVCNYSALEFPKAVGGFDRVLLDAPCSGTGVIAKDASVKTNKTELDFMRLPHLQKQLILAAIDSVDHSSKTGGYIVYSTCSVTIEENEQVVQYALNKRPNVKLVETGLSFGKEGFTSIMGKTFHPTMKLTRRYYPHTYNVDGFFVAKFKKFGLTPANAIGANGVASTNGKPTSDQQTQEEFVDKTPITESGDEDSDFGGWDDDEDQVYMERAEKAQLRRKGKNPKAVPSNAKKAENVAEKAVEKNEVEASGGGGSKAKEVDVVIKNGTEKPTGKKQAKAIRANGASNAKKAGVDAQAAKADGVSGVDGGAELKPRKKSGGRKGKA